MRRTARGLVLLVAVALVPATPAGVATARTRVDPRARRVDALFADLNRRPSPGLAIVVVRDGKVLLRRGYGLANVEHRVPVTPSTVFDLASLSKQFTGLAVAMLVAEGKIRLSDDVRKYIPELQDMGRPITVAHLVHQTSGMRDWVATLSVAGWRPDDPITLKHILTMAANQRTLNFEPGAERFYSNTDYTLLAEIVQRVTGKSFRAWTDEHIFRPLGMSSTHVRDDYAEVIPNRAFGYARGPNGTYRHTPNLLVAPGSSSVFGSADDFAFWLMNFDRAKVGGRAAIELMHTPGTLNDGTKVPYGFGILHGSYRGLPMFTTSGGWASFNSFDVYFPEQKFGVVVLANGDGPELDAQSAVIKITDIYLEGELDPVPPAGGGTGEAAAPQPAALDAYVGLYRLEGDSYVRVERYGAALVARVPRRGPMLMSPRSEREFSVEREDEVTAIVFERDATGAVASLTYGGRRASRVADADARAPAQLADYAGDYDSEELGTSYRVAVRNGALELQHRRRGTIPLTWLWRDEFGSLDAYLGSIDFLRDGAGRVVGFVVNGSPRSRDIRFVKRDHG